MCNIAGYVGDKNATPILIEMIRIQEGMYGGYYTGLAVHDGEKIHYRKVQGELSVLLQETDAQNLVGKTGIIHSRTPGGGNWLWAHPFVTERGGEVKMAYVANGSAGAFRDNRSMFDTVAEELVAGGYDIPCKLDLDTKKYGRLPTGEAVHMSDVMCQLIYRNRDKGMDTASAMTAAFTEMPSEIVGLVVEAESPDRIYYSRINKPMFVGFADDGAYLASSPMAFPKEIEEFHLLPPLSSGVVYKDHYETEPYPDFPMQVAPFDEAVIEEAKSIVLALLTEKECSTKELFSAVKQILPQNILTQRESITYPILTHLHRQSRLQTRLTHTPAPKLMFSLG